MRRCLEVHDDHGGDSGEDAVEGGQRRVNCHHPLVSQEEEEEREDHEDAREDRPPKELVQQTRGEALEHRPVEDTVPCFAASECEFLPVLQRLIVALVDLVNHLLDLLGLLAVAVVVAHVVKLDGLDLGHRHARHVGLLTRVLGQQNLRVVLLELADGLELLLDLIHLVGPQVLHLGVGAAQRLGRIGRGGASDLLHFAVRLQLAAVGVQTGHQRVFEFFGLAVCSLVGFVCDLLDPVVLLLFVFLGLVLAQEIAGLLALTRPFVRLIMVFLHGVSGVLDCRDDLGESDDDVEQAEDEDLIEPI
mmetsp:Transcript_34885/g.86575  ORF Transcript_34885/g.86575 Transcript_34885/m.86575 type:complete len:304 (-) Transcript_34885:3421-4332(-)